MRIRRVLATALEDLMHTVTICWCGNSDMVLGRVVLDPKLPEAARIRQLALGLKIPVVEEHTSLLANDLWVSITPNGGWGDLAGETMWARSIEAPIVIQRLENAKVVADRFPWAIEFRNGSYFQNLEADNGGAIGSAQRFRNKVDTESFMNSHEWIYHHGGMAVEIKED